VRNDINIPNGARCTRSPDWQSGNAQVDRIEVIMRVRAESAAVHTSPRYHLIQR
jgi:hypothetical protein